MIPTAIDVQARIDALSTRQTQIREFVAKASANLDEWTGELAKVDSEILSCQSWLALQATYEHAQQGEIFAKVVPSE